MIALALLISCQGPLGDRHEIAGDRILSVVADPPGGLPGDTIRAHALLAVAGNLWTDAASDLRWYWVEPTDSAVAAIDSEDPPAGIGPAPELIIPSEHQRLALLVQNDGTAPLRAFLDVRDTAHLNPTLENLSVETVEDVTLQTLTAQALNLDSRANWTTVQTTSVSGGDILRFTASAVAEAPLRTRWTATAPYGTFFELSPLQTDWVAGTLTLEDDDLRDVQAL